MSKVFDEALFLPAVGQARDAVELIMPRYVVVRFTADFIDQM